MYFLHMDEAVSWKAGVSLLMWPIALDPSGMGGHTGNMCYCQHGSRFHLDMEAPLLCQSISGGGG
jgi:hypothetical protein